MMLGFSQGAATASRWAAYGGLQPDELVLWSGLLAHDLDRARAAERLGDTRVRFVVGRDDRFRNDAALAEQQAWLDQVGVGCGMVDYDGGHRLDPDTLLQLARDT
ncbi:MAG: hypothetical protein P8099_11170 [Gemmatimonadota bacterium]